MKVISDFLNGEKITVPKGMTAKGVVDTAKYVLSQILKTIGPEEDVNANKSDTELCEEMSRLVAATQEKAEFKPDIKSDKSPEDRKGGQGNSAEVPDAPKDGTVATGI